MMRFIQNHVSLSVRAGLALFGAVLLWSSSFIALKIAVSAFDPMVMVFGRMLSSLVALMLLRVTVWRRAEAPMLLDRRVTRREWKYIVLLALCAAACAAALLIAAGEPLAALLRTLADKTGLSGAVFTPLWKVLAIALTVRVGGAFCRDAAQGALASVLETAGAVCALTAAAPLLLAVAELVEGWL